MAKKDAYRIVVSLSTRAEIVESLDRVIKHLQPGAKYPIDRSRITNCLWELTVHAASLMDPAKINDRASLRSELERVLHAADTYRARFAEPAWFSPTVEALALYVGSDAGQVANSLYTKLAAITPEVDQAAFVKQAAKAIKEPEGRAHFIERAGRL